MSSATDSKLVQQFNTIIYFFSNLNHLSIEMFYTQKKKIANRVFINYHATIKNCKVEKKYVGESSYN